VADPEGRRSQAPLIGLIAGGTAISAGLGFVLLCVFARLADGHGAWWITGHHLSSGQWYDIVRSTIGSVGVFGIGAAGLLAYRRQRTSEDTYRLELGRHADSQVVDLRSRFAKAAEQLGHDSPAVRLAGVYAMAALADDWHAAGDDAQMQVCIDVLCAYLRIPYDPDSPKAKEGEKQVRWTVISVIRDHLQDPTAANSWCGRDFDFSRTTFDGGDFRKVQFSGGIVSFARAQFSGGIVNFARAQFSGGIVNFAEAQFSAGSVDFARATFSGGSVNFARAQFSGGGVIFSEATFSGGIVNFDGVTFSAGSVIFARATFSGGSVNFDGATFSGGDVMFARAQFSGGDVIFSEATFSGGIVNFDGATFSGGIVIFLQAEFSGGRVNFDGATFSGGDVTFSVAQFFGGSVIFARAQFSAGSVIFSDAQFSGGAVDFDGAQFSGGAVDFDGAQFSGGAVDFDGAQFSGGDVDFVGAKFAGGAVSFTPTSETWLSPPIVDWAEDDEIPQGVEPRVWPASLSQ